MKPRPRKSLALLAAIKQQLGCGSIYCTVDNKICLVSAWVCEYQLSLIFIAQAKWFWAIKIWS